MGTRPPFGGGIKTKANEDFGKKHNYKCDFDKEVSRGIWPSKQKKTWNWHSLQKCLENQNRMRHTTWAFVAGLIGLFMFLVGIGLARFGAQSLIKMWAWEKLTLKNNSEAMKRWMRSSLPISMKVYLFNVTNPKDVSEGALPVLAEVGPYVYEQTREKINIVQLDNYILSYQLRNIIQFKPDRSGRLKESDLVTILNVPLAGTIVILQETVPEFVGLYENIWRMFFPGQSSIFMTTSVREILFDGITIDCTSRMTEVYIACRGLDNQKGYSVRREGKNFKFSFFYSKNGTSSETFQTYQGKDDLTKSAQYVGMNYSPSLRVWKNDYCDKINGSDGAQFPVLLNKTQKLYVFEKDLCRSVYVEFEQELNQNGVPLYKFSNSDSLFASPNENPDNACFCRSPLRLKDLVRDEDENDIEDTQQHPKICFQNGVLPLMPCIDAPIIVSFPHFYLGDQSYVNYSGLTPIKDLHETFFIVEPITGTSVTAFKRIQFNVEVRRISDFPMASKLVDGLFPILWVEEEMHLSPDLFKLLKYSLIGKKVLENGTYVLIVLGLALVIIACVAHMFAEKATCTRTAGQEGARRRLGMGQSSKGSVFPSGAADLNFLH